jgi:CheY-like chemotaxis protein
MQPAENSPEKMRILFVEDNPVVATAYGKLLESGGYAVVQCDNGEKALRMLEHEKFDCVVSDLMLPELDGVEFLKLASLLLWEHKTPIIVLSQVNLTMVQAQVKKYGVGAYLCKDSIKPEDLMTAVRKCIDEARQQPRLTMSQTGEQPKINKVEHVIDDSVGFEPPPPAKQPKRGLLDGLFGE